MNDNIHSTHPIEIMSEEKTPEQKPTDAKTATDAVDWSPFFDYIQSVQGHEVVSRLLTMVEDIKKLAIERSHAHSQTNQWLNFGVIGLIVAAVVALSVFGKMDATTGTMLGTAAGYFFGKSK